ncbi:DUF397 domain-containing protein [Streptomyces sp. NPDC052052]|uniref:DUF397 domain-containing protein n=1 Tax=Streptomyces sp. NPDC052052 TaxID=3154756 RepID=UPI0034381D76
MNVEATTDTATAPLHWFKSSYSGAEGGQCLEVAARPGLVHVRDSKDLTGPVLTLTARGWCAFVEFAARG